MASDSDEDGRYEMDDEVDDIMDDIMQEEDYYYDQQGRVYVEETDDEEDEDEEEEDEEDDIEYYDGEEGGVFCDECGDDRMVGFRYRSTTQNNYDICQECLEENYNNDATGFARYDEETDPVMPTLPDTPVLGVGCVCDTFTELANLAPLQDPASRIDDITLFLTTEDSRELPAEEKAKVTRLLSSHTKLKEMEIQIIEEPDKCTGAIVALAKGLQHNTSVRSMAWTVEYHYRVTEEACQAIKELMTQNTTIRFMFFFGPSGPFYPPPRATNNMSHSRLLQDTLFDALLTTHLETVRIDVFDPNNSPGATDDHKKKAWKAMEENPRLKRIKTRFENDDYMLELLRKDKKYGWTQSFQTAEGVACWNILQNALMELRKDERFDNVYGIYHFLRSRPDVILP